MSGKKKTNKELNEDMEALAKKVTELENMMINLTSKLNETNENQENIKDIHEKVSKHDSILNDLQKTSSNSQKDKLFKCTECDSQFKSKSLMKQHFKKEHWVPTVKLWDNCDEIFVENWELEVHLKSHSDAEIYSCNKCDKTFVLKWRLEKHKKGHMGKICCHYYNNMKKCPFEKIGCMFLHSESENCKFQNKCRKKMCQYKHLGIKPTEETIDDNKSENVNDMTDYTTEKEKTINDETENDTTENKQSVNDKNENEEILHVGKNRTNTDHEENDKDKFDCFKCDRKFRNRDNLITHFKTHMTGFQIC